MPQEKTGWVPLSDEEILNWANESWQTYKNRVAEMIGVTPRDVKFRMADLDKEGVVAQAYSQEGIVDLDRKWFSENPKDIGAIIHEGTHVLTEAFGQTVSEEDKEAVADATRARLGMVHEGWIPTPHVAQLAKLPDDQLREVIRAITTEGFGEETVGPKAVRYRPDEFINIQHPIHPSASSLAPSPSPMPQPRRQQQPREQEEPESMYGRGQQR